MMWIRQIATVVLIGIASLYSVDNRMAVATEAAPTEPAQALTPTAPHAPASTSAPSKPHVLDGESKTPARAPAPPSSSGSMGKDQVLSKPPTKSQPPANGSRGSKPGGMTQLPVTITGADGAPMVLIPAGEFTMGSEKGDDDEQPIHRVFLDTFYLDKFEVTNGRFAKFVEAIHSEPPWGFKEKETPVLQADQPVRWVNWMDAVGYCLWAGKRLPTEAEWEKAARGTDGRVYPWGNEPPTPAQAVFGLKEGDEAVSPVGHREKGQSPYGVHDLAGNLYEWTRDWYDEQFYTTNPAVNPRGPDEGSTKVQRGGSYTNTPYRLRSSFRTKGDPTEHDPHVGFRCAHDVPPTP